MDRCGPIGTYIPYTMLAFAPGELSTIQWPAWDRRSIPLEATKSFNFADLPCPPSDVMVSLRLQKRKHSELTYVSRKIADQYKPAPGSPYRPVLSPPPQIYYLQPGWSNCVITHAFAGIDPPRPLTPAAALVPNPTTASSTHSHEADTISPSLHESEPGTIGAGNDGPTRKPSPAPAHNLKPAGPRSTSTPSPSSSPSTTLLDPQAPKKSLDPHESQVAKADSGLEDLHAPESSETATESRTSSETAKETSSSSPSAANFDPQLPKKSLDPQESQVAKANSGLEDSHARESSKPASESRTSSDTAKEKTRIQDPSHEETEIPNLLNFFRFSRVSSSESFDDTKSKSSPNSNTIARTSPPTTHGQTLLLNFLRFSRAMSSSEISNDTKSKSSSSPNSNPITPTSPPPTLTQHGEENYEAGTSQPFPFPFPTSSPTFFSLISNGASSSSQNQQHISSSNASTRTLPSQDGGSGNTIMQQLQEESENEEEDPQGPRTSDSNSNSNSTAQQTQTAFTSSSSSSSSSSSGSIKISPSTTTVGGGVERLVQASSTSSNSSSPVSKVLPYTSGDEKRINSFQFRPISTRKFISFASLVFFAFFGFV